jgi:murein DD-endopeptidase MepM/ murein hydrolase activator NlpD
MKHCIAPQQGRVSFLVLLLVVALAALIPIAVVGWKDLYESFLERSAPVIRFVEKPRGVGIAPVRLVIELEDYGSGLDEVVVRAEQKGRTQELERRALEGVQKQEISLQFPGRESGFEEGNVLLQVRAFDRSIWSNRGEEQLSFVVDYRRPIIEVLSQQHNGRIGGSQLLLYRAVDESLTLSGVKVGSEAFLGYPGRLFDSDLHEDDLFGVLYALPLLSRKPAVRAFAEDSVGNARLSTFYSKETPRKVRPRRVNISRSCLRVKVHELFEASRGTLRDYVSPGESKLSLQTPVGSLERQQEEFQLLNRDLRLLNDAQLERITKKSRYQRYWWGAFEKQFGTVRFGNAERLAFFSEDRVIADRVHDGYFYRENSPQQSVIAANNGVVSFAGALGVYGNTVVLDHGLGLSTVYAHLDRIDVSEGAKVDIGDEIGVMGDSGLSCEAGVFFQVRVHGIPVEPAEWLSKSWFHDHIERKVEATKRGLGITFPSPF